MNYETSKQFYALNTVWFLYFGKRDDNTYKNFPDILPKLSRDSSLSTIVCMGNDWFVLSLIRNVCCVVCLAYYKGMDIEMIIAITGINREKNLRKYLKISYESKKEKLIKVFGALCENWLSLSVKLFLKTL